ncbi:MAG: hypothetical protein K6U02_09010 [Firmicutes bacterium]|nr:hypothetical protein [Bacillota bacterium]
MKSRHELLLALLATYLHRVAFPFLYGVGQHQFPLPMVAWLRDPSLFPNDPIREAFAIFPSLFWRAVAWLTNGLELQTLLLIGLFLFHFLSFWGLTRMIARDVPDARFLTILLLGIALSPMLTSEAPFGGGGGIFGGLMTQTTLAGTLAIWAVFCLLEGRWVWGALLLGLMLHIHVLLAVHLGFVFLAFLWRDWYPHRRQIIGAGSILLLFGLGWLVLWRQALRAEYPEGYVETLLMHYPYHLVLSMRPVYYLLLGLFVLAGMIAVVVLAIRRGVTRNHRFELLVASLLVPILLGVLVGEWLRVPKLMLLQLLRADTYLILFGLVLVAMYGFRLLVALWNQAPAAAVLVAVPAMLYPLAEGRALPAFLIVAAGVAADRQHRFDRVCRWLAQKHPWMGWAPLIFAFGAAGVLWWRGSLDPARLTILFAMASAPLVYRSRARAAAIQTRTFAVLGSLVVLVGSVALLVRPVAMFWRPIRPLPEVEAAWREVQIWARENTSKDTVFLVPPFPGGFRIFSQRSCWVSWKDGDIFWVYPPYAPEWRSRFAALGLPLTVGHLDPEAITAAYRKLSWERLSELARGNNLRYIVQHADIPYEVAPVWSNEIFAIYLVAK